MSRDTCSRCGRTMITFPGDLEPTCGECRSLPDSCGCDPVAEAARVPARAARPLRRYDLTGLIREGVPPPELMCGDLLYRGGLHSISGPPDCGKTTIALWWILQHVRSGGTVMFLDEEGGAELVAEKLIALGATVEDAQRIHYFPFPARTWDVTDLTLLFAEIDELKPTLVLWDSSAAFLSRAGLDENSAADVTKFWAQVLTPIAREHGSAVVVIDHDTKAGEASRFARGSGAKLAACDVAFKVTLVKAFSRAENGVLRFHVSKDRRGWLHRDWEVGVQTSGGMSLHFTETEEDEDGEQAEQKLTPADTKVLSVLTDTPSSTKEITDRIAERYGHGLKRQTLSESLNKLLRRGIADRLDQGNGRPALWSVSAGQTCQVTGPAKNPDYLSPAA